jgi:hypothetical protein
MPTFEKNIHDLGRNQRNRIGSLNNCGDQSFEFLFLCQNVSSLDIAGTNFPSRKDGNRTAELYRV